MTMRSQESQNEVTQADQVRDYAYSTYIKPARDAGQEIVRIRCGDVHTALGLVARYSIVCSALGTKKFRREHRMEIVRTEGPFFSSKLVITFRLLPL
jgi:hypothetical protein